MPDSQGTPARRRDVSAGNVRQLRAERDEYRLVGEAERLVLAMASAARLLGAERDVLDAAVAGVTASRSWHRDLVTMDQLIECAPGFDSVNGRRKFGQHLLDLAEKGWIHYPTREVSRGSKRRREASKVRGQRCVGVPWWAMPDPTIGPCYQCGQMDTGAIPDEVLPLLDRVPHQAHSGGDRVPHQAHNGVDCVPHQAHACASPGTLSEEYSEKNPPEKARATQERMTLLADVSADDEDERSGADAPDVSVGEQTVAAIGRFLRHNGFPVQQAPRSGLVSDRCEALREQGWTEGGIVDAVAGAGLRGGVNDVWAVIAKRLANLGSPPRPTIPDQVAPIDAPAEDDGPEWRDLLPPDQDADDFASRVEKRAREHLRLAVDALDLELSEQGHDAFLTVDEHDRADAARDVAYELFGRPIEDGRLIAPGAAAAVHEDRFAARTRQLIRQRLHQTA